MALFSIYPKVNIGREVKQAAMLMYEKSLETLSSVSDQNIQVLPLLVLPQTELVEKSLTAAMKFSVDVFTVVL